MAKKTNKAQRRCECPARGEVSTQRSTLYSEEERPGMNHAPNKCHGTYQLAQYRRGNRVLWLCSCCNLPGDVLVEDHEPKAA